jgi:YHS domain-containing protein
MRTTLAAVFLALAVSSGTLLAEDQHDEHTTATLELIAQTRCPVMGGTIDSAYYTDMHGQRVYHCCGGCSEKFAGDPDTYFLRAASQHVLFENIQSRCPVSGKAIDETVYADWGGRRIYFSSEKSREKFLDKPTKYLIKLPGQPKQQRDEEHDSHQGGHSGHGGGCGM